MSLLPTATTDAAFSLTVKAYSTMPTLSVKLLAPIPQAVALTVTLKHPTLLTQ